MNSSSTLLGLAVVSVLAGGMAAGPGQASTPAPGAAELLAMARHVVDHRRPLSEIWPGYWPADQSFIISEPPVGYIRVDNGAAPLFEEGTLEAGGRPFVFDFPGGPPNTIFVRRRGGAEETWRTLFHEQFHDFQTDRFTGGGGIRGEFVDLSNVADRIALTADMELERRVLAAAIRADSPDLRDDLARRYLALRRTRESALDDAIIATERARERYEGSADYVRVRAIEILTERGASQEQVLANLESSLMSGGASYMTRWFRERAYGVGAAIGILLDRMGVDWQGEVERGAAFDLLLERQLGSADRATAQDVAAATRRLFGGPVVLAEIQEAFASGPPEMTGLADVYALGEKRLVLEVASNPDGGAAARLQFAASMHPVSRTAMALTDVRSFHLSGEGVSAESENVPALIDSRGPEGDRPGASVYTLMLEDFTALGPLGRFPQGETRLDRLESSGANLTVTIDRPVVVSVGVDEIRVYVEPSH